MIRVYIVWSVNILMKVLSFGTHISGLYAICHCKCTTNQSKILFNIGITELSIIIPKTIKTLLQISSTYRFHRISETGSNASNPEAHPFRNVQPIADVYVKIHDAIVFSLTTLLSLLMLMLIADRFLSTKYPFRYKIRFQRMNVKGHIMGVYAVAAAEGVIYFTQPTLKSILLYVLVAIALIFLLLSVATYTMIIKKVRSSR